MIQDPIDQMFSFTLNGVAFAIEIIGKVTPEILHFFGLLKNGGLKKEGEIALDLLKRGNGIEALNLREKELETFKEAAKGNGLRYAVSTLDKVNKPGERLMTVYFSPVDTAIVNQIIEINSLNTVKAGSAKMEEAGEPEIPMPEDKDEPMLPETPPEEDWLQFFGPAGEFGTPEENRARAEELEHLDPTQPESRNESPSKNSSGRFDGNGKKQKGDNLREPEAQTTYNGAPTQARSEPMPGESTAGADPRPPIEEQIRQVREQRAARKAALETPAKDNVEKPGETFKQFAARVLEDDDVR